MNKITFPLVRKENLFRFDYIREETFNSEHLIYPDDVPKFLKKFWVPITRKINGKCYTFYPFKSSFDNFDMTGDNSYFKVTHNDINVNPLYTKLFLKLIKENIEITSLLKDKMEGKIERKNAIFKFKNNRDIEFTIPSKIINNERTIILEQIISGNINLNNTKRLKLLIDNTYSSHDLKFDNLSKDLIYLNITNNLFYQSLRHYNSYNDVPYNEKVEVRNYPSIKFTKISELVAKENLTLNNIRISDENNEGLKEINKISCPNMHLYYVNTNGRKKPLEVNSKMFSAYICNGPNKLEINSDKKSTLWFNGTMNFANDATDVNAQNLVKSKGYTCIIDKINCPHIQLMNNNGRKDDQIVIKELETSKLDLNGIAVLYLLNINRQFNIIRARDGIKIYFNKNQKDLININNADCVEYIKKNILEPCNKLELDEHGKIIISV